MTVWTEPPTYAAGNVPTATQLNASLRDNILHLREQLDWPFGFVACGEPEQARSPAWPVANRCIFQRCRGFGTITNIGIHVITSAGTIGLAVYENEGDYEDAAPVTRVGTSGSIACPAAGFASTAVVASTAIQAGSHWFALSCSSISAEFTGIQAMTFAAVVRGAGAIQEGAHPPPVTPALRGHSHPSIGMVGL